MQRLDRTGYRPEHLMEEIRVAEDLLDELGAEKGLPLHRRIQKVERAAHKEGYSAGLADANTFRAAHASDSSKCSQCGTELQAGSLTAVAHASERKQ